MSQAIDSSTFADDPDTVEERIASIKNAQFMPDVLALANEYLPNWVAGFIDKYSDDYPALTAQWERVCDQEEVGSKKQIMITRFMSTSPAYRLLQSFAEVFVAAGFSVRRLQDIIPCKVCKAGIPTMGLHSSMKLANLAVPEKWSDTCGGCSAD
jgi:hypothetical protein